MESATTPNMTLSIPGVLSAILQRRSPAYEVIYFYGDKSATSAVIDQLLCKAPSSGRTASVIRLDSGMFIQKRFQMTRRDEPISDSFDSKLCNCTFFVFEGIDNIAGLQTVEQAIYGLFDWLLEYNVQMVITGSIPVSCMYMLAPRIRAQLEGGISCKIMKS